jgi:hypothetical protein
MRSKTIIFSLLVACLPGLFAPIPALAVPPLPSSFYGVVEVDGATVPDGTIVRGLINGETCAEGYIQIYEGSPAYSLDVPGDDTATTARDGGLEGDTVQFEVGGVLADQTGTWHSGTNVELNLILSVTGPLPAPQATPTPLPTQTPIPRAQPSPVPATLTQAAATIVAPGQPSPMPVPSEQLLSTLVAPAEPVATTVVAGQPSSTLAVSGQSSATPSAPEQASATPATAAQSAPTSIAPEQPAPMRIPPEKSGENDSNSPGAVLVVVVIVLAAVGVVWVLLRRRCYDTFLGIWR